MSRGSAARDDALFGLSNDGHTKQTDKRDIEGAGRGVSGWGLEGEHTVKGSVYGPSDRMTAHIIFSFLSASCSSFLLSIPPVSAVCQPLVSIAPLSAPSVLE